MTNIQQLIKDNHIKLRDQDIDEHIPDDEVIPEDDALSSPERAVDGDMSDDDEIKDETELATEKSPRGENLDIDEDIIPDYQSNTKVKNSEVTTEKLVNHLIESSQRN